MEDSSRREFLERSAAAVSARAAGFEAAYLSLERSGELARRSAQLFAIYRQCRLCPRQCGVNRARGEKGVCSAGDRAKVYSSHAHFGEERPLVGRGGSGTIFFSHCNLLCVYCQNWEINHRGDGTPVSDERLGRLMVDLQNAGCHNINLVTPTHVLPNLIGGLRAAIGRGLRVPLVYNCGGYEPVEVIRLLDGIVDIYLPDFKYTEGAMAEKYSHGARDYPERAAAAIEEMHRQVGELRVDERGIAQRGLIIRHLVLPHNIAGTGKFVKFVAERLTRSTAVNLMAQYRPEHEARRYPELARRLTNAEFEQARRWALEAGLTRLL
jgi:putative pyruvate formate lyase activating enzyme